MDRLENISLTDLWSQLEAIDEKVPAQRVLTAIGYKQGDSVTTLAERHAVSGQTIRNWLDRFAEQPIEHAPYDEDRSGRPPKLTDEQKQVFIANLHESPEEVGYDRQTWFPLLAHQHLIETFDVEYSLRHVRRLMTEAGLSWRTARPRHYEADPEKEAEFQATVEKNETA